MIGSPRVYLLRNRRTITWVSEYRYPIWTFCNWIPTWLARQLLAHWWLLSQCFFQFSNLRKKRYRRFRLKDILIPKCSIDTINSWLDLVSYNSGSKRARNFKSDFKLLARLLPELYNTSYDYYFLDCDCFKKLLFSTKGGSGAALRMSLTQFN